MAEAALVPPSLSALQGTLQGEWYIIIQVFQIDGLVRKDLILLPEVLTNVRLEGHMNLSEKDFVSLLHF